MKVTKTVVKLITICVYLMYNVADFLEMTMVCNSNNATEPLNCRIGQWIQIVSEVYIPQAISQTNNTISDSCEFDFSTDCSWVKTDMNVNCHGPMPVDGCKELVDVIGVRQEAPCFNSISQVVVMVQYDCIDGSNIVDLCNGEHTSQTIFLASPNFPYTMSQNTVCVCNIQGSVLSIRGLLVNVNTKLPWGLSDQYTSVLTVKNPTKFVWHSSTLCKNCSSLHLINEDIYLSKSTYNENISVTYSNFGLSDQIVWLQVTGQGQTITVSCNSSPLPSERIITTTIPTKHSIVYESSLNTTSLQSMLTSATLLTTISTSTSTPTISTTISASTISTTTMSTPTSTEDQRNTTTLERTSQTSTLTTTHIITSTYQAGTSSKFNTPTDQTNKLQTPTRIVATTELTNKSLTLNTATDRTTTTQISESTTAALTVTAISSINKLTSPILKTDASKYVSEGTNKSESPTLVIILAVILFVLLIIAAIVGVIVFRKRRHFNYQGKKGFKALFLSLYDQMTSNRRSQENEQVNSEFHKGSFDGIELSEGDVQTKDSVNRPEKMLPYTSLAYKGDNSDLQNIADVSYVIENIPANKTFFKEALKTPENQHEIICSDQVLKSEKNIHGDSQLKETSTGSSNDLNVTQFTNDMTSGHQSSNTNSTNPDQTMTGRSHKKHLGLDHHSSLSLFAHCNEENIRPDGEEHIHEVMNNDNDLDTREKITKRLKSETEKNDASKYNEGMYKKNFKSQLVSNILLQSLDEIKKKRKLQVQDEGNSTKTSKDLYISYC